MVVEKLPSRGWGYAALFAVVGTIVGMAIWLAPPPVSHPMEQQTHTTAPVVFQSDPQVEAAANQFIMNVAAEEQQSPEYVQLIWCQELQLGSEPREKWRQNGIDADIPPEFVDAVGKELDSRCES
jgi:hypothetical protein